MEDDMADKEDDARLEQLQREQYEEQAAIDEYQAECAEIDQLRTTNARLQKELVEARERAEKCAYDDHNNCPYAPNNAGAKKHLSTKLADSQTRANDLQKELVWACEIVYYSERFNGETSEKAEAILERVKGG